MASFWASTASTCMSLTRQPTGCEWDGAGPGLCSRPGPNLKPLRDQPPNMGGGVGERLLLVQNKTRLPRNPSHTPASWHKPWSAMTPIGAERRRWFAFSPTQRLLVSSSCHWVMTTLPRVCCTQGQHTVSVADVFEGAATTGMHALITRHGMTVGRRLVRRARKKKTTVDASVRGRVLLFVSTALGASPSAYHPTSLVASCCGWSQQVS